MCRRPTRSHSERSRATCEAMNQVKLPSLERCAQVACAERGLGRKQPQSQHRPYRYHIASLGRRARSQRRVPPGARRHLEVQSAYHDRQGSSLTGTESVHVPVKRHRGEPGHTRDTRDTRAHAGKRITRTNLTTIHPNPKTQTRTKTATDSTAARTAASPESTAPRGRLRRGRPQRTRPCLHPLPERLPAPARRRSAK